MKNNERYTGQGGITVIAEIDSAVNTQELYTLLYHIGDNIKTTPVIDFEKMEGLHFCRWFIIEGLVDATGCTFSASLVYAAYYDGTAKYHLNELLNNCLSSVKLIYGYCKEFPVGAAATNEAIIIILKKA